MQYTREDYQAVINHFGEVAQMEKACEEMDELKKEIWNYMEHSKDNRKERLTEMADVMNMLVQLQIIWGFTGDELSLEMDRKMQRTFTRIEKELEDE